MIIVIAVQAPAPAANASKRTEIRYNMLSLKKSLLDLIGLRSI